MDKMQKIFRKIIQQKMVIEQVRTAEEIREKMDRMENLVKVQDMST
jgi:D-ribose pyranose/furanose isomerase RbsD